MINRVGIIVNNKKSKALEASHYLSSEFLKRGISVWMEGDQCSHQPLDLLIILGGDGTVL